MNQKYATFALIAIAGLPLALVAQQSQPAQNNARQPTPGQPNASQPNVRSTDTQDGLKTRGEAGSQGWQYGKRRAEQQFRTWSSLKNLDIYAANGQEVGKITNFFVDRGSGQISHAVVQTSSSMNMGSNSIVVPYESLAFDAATDRFRLDDTSSSWNDFPIYTNEEWAKLRESKPSGNWYNGTNNSGYGRDGRPRSLYQNRQNQLNQNQMNTGTDSRTGTNMNRDSAVGGNVNDSSQQNRPANTTQITTNNESPRTSTSTPQAITNNESPRTSTSTPQATTPPTNQRTTTVTTAATSAASSTTAPNSTFTSRTETTSNNSNVRTDAAERARQESARNQNSTPSQIGQGNQPRQPVYDQSNPNASQSRQGFNDWMWNESSRNRQYDSYDLQWDTGSKSRIEGEVKRVERVSIPGSGEQMLVEVVDGGGVSKKVLLGPSWYIAGSEAAINRGDKIVIDVVPVHVATSAQINGRSVSLRRDDGRGAEWDQPSYKQGNKFYATPYSQRLQLASIEKAKLDCRGTTCGDIDDVIIELSEGRVAFLSIDPNENFLGINDTKRLVPWNVASIGLVDNTVRVDASKEMLVASMETPTNLAGLNDEGASAAYKAFQIEPWQGSNDRWMNREGDLSTERNGDASTTDQQRPPR